MYYILYFRTNSFIEEYISAFNVFTCLYTQGICLYTLVSLEIIFQDYENTSFTPKISYSEFYFIRYFQFTYFVLLHIVDMQELWS